MTTNVTNATHTEDHLDELILPEDDPIDNIITQGTEEVEEAEEEYDPDEPQQNLPERKVDSVWADIDTELDWDKGSMLNTTFKTVRAEVFDNYFMNGDTIAL